MNDEKKAAIFEELVQFDQVRHRVEIPEGVVSLEEVMAANDWKEDKARKLVAAAVKAGVVEKVRVGTRLYYRMPGG